MEQGGNTLRQVKEIFNGWINLMFPNEEVETLAKSRLEICFKCPERKNNKCGKCGCPLEAKTRSVNSKCPISKW